MTREEEITQQANENYPSLDSEKSYYGFKDGAKWADEHPSQELKRQIVNKAVEWLENNYLNYEQTYADVGGYISSDFNIDKMLIDFKQAMKEE